MRQQAKALQPLVEQVLRIIKQTEGLEGPLQPEIWDNGDAVVCWRSQNMACVLFPSAPTWKKVDAPTMGNDQISPSIPLTCIPSNASRHNRWQQGGSWQPRGLWRESLKHDAPERESTKALVRGELIAVLLQGNLLLVHQT